MLRAALILLGTIFLSSMAFGCGLDWTLPASHFESVDEKGYVEYWEKIGQVDLGDGLVIPINISFNSHQEASSPSLGKGWMVALLESHVEPVDDNTMRVIMPDGWIFTFIRNGNTDTWRGNAGWIGETNDTVFTIKAPCGSTVKFDGGKIQEIDTNKNRILTYKYNASNATEVDIDGKAFVQVESDNIGTVTDLSFGGEKIQISQARRPHIVRKLGQNLIVGFDPSLSLLQRQDSNAESFEFGTDKELNPNLTITHPDQTQRRLSWDPETRTIKGDGDWSYLVAPQQNGQAVTLLRTNKQGGRQSWLDDRAVGLETTEDDGVLKSISRFTSGKLAGLVRKVVENDNGVQRVVYSESYNEDGFPTRITDLNGTRTFEYDNLKHTIKCYKNSQLLMTTTLDDQNKIVSVVTGTGINLAAKTDSVVAPTPPSAAN